MTILELVKAHKAMVVMTGVGLVWEDDYRRFVVINTRTNEGVRHTAYEEAAVEAMIDESNKEDELYKKEEEQE